MSDDRWPSFKVVWTDGFARETVSERVVAEWLSAEDAETICQQKRDASTWEGDWWIIKPQSAKLWGGWAEFM